ncbi:hypothetical protein [Enemella evansiae]|uniref:Uncharacterized protein n=1 Tax=Enemella evansiae TaxID=2016499 RepID=A0A255GEZ2_9ACTN|nr:hypothetical protein [Enemella evansiae]OYO05054.1 hypothetical protein CGZ95_01760 [Enemella evansiae]OYO07515.1 hypothetical protein CGZ98_18895 [Enemella evansiae]OYO14419.1 hypothetical protein CGZ94_07365 [Enemella evansiae]
MNSGMLIGIVALVLGLAPAIVGVRLAYVNPPESAGRRRGVLIAVLGLGIIWIGGFIGAFASLGGI